MEIKVFNYNGDNLADVMPRRAHENDAAYDVFTHVSVILSAHQVVKVPLGFGVEVPPGFMACIFPRGGWATKGVLPQLPPIDCGYTGEVHAIVLNATDEDIHIDAGTKVGQLVFIPIYHFNLVETSSTARGDAGFGSTGFVKQ